MKALSADGVESPIVSIRLSPEERKRYARCAPNGNVSAFMRASAAYLWRDWVRCKKQIATYFAAYAPLERSVSTGLVAVDWNWVAPRLLAAIVSSELSNVACIPARNSEWVWCGWIRPERAVSCVLWGVMPRVAKHETFGQCAVATLALNSSWSARAAFVRELWLHTPSRQWHKVGSNATP